jgi:hypothetical protein
MIPVAPISGGFAPRPNGSGPLSAAEGPGIEQMLLKLEEDSFHYKIALRVRSEGAASQPLARIDVTDLALMIITGGAMSRALDTVSAGSTLPGAYGQNW